MSDFVLCAKGSGHNLECTLAYCRRLWSSYCDQAERCLGPREAPSLHAADGVIIMSSESHQAKWEALRQIADVLPIVPAGTAKVTVGQRLIHIRFCSENHSAPGKYKFNINPNTLSADFELWICGCPKHFYLMPVSLMTEFYQHPGAYVDGRHPDIRIVSVDAQQHRATYARGGTSANLIQYFGALLP